MLTPNFNICQCKCDKIVFNDLTGDYVVTDNEGGWGTPNIERADVTNSYLSIEDASAVTQLVDITAEVVAGDTEICINATQLGYSSDIPDGIYKITWVIETLTESVNECKEFFFYCIVACKVDNMIADLSSSNCGCKDSSEADDALLAFTLLKALESAACCYKIEKFNDLLETITTIADSKPCKNC